MKSGKVRLGLDARIFSQPMNGVARHLILLIKGLAERKDFEVYLFSDTPLREEYARYYSAYPVILFDRPNLKKYWKNWVLPFQLSKYNIDLYHAIWDKGVPLAAPCPVVMSIHDLYAVSPDNKDAKPVKKFRRLASLLFETRKAKKVLTISEISKHEIIKLLGVPEDKILVAYLDCDRGHIESVISGEDKTGLPYGLAAGGYFVSIIGRLDDVRKNVPFLIRSYARFIKVMRGRGCKLVIVGSYDEESGYFIRLRELARRVNVEDCIIFTGYVSDAVLYDLIRQSRAMVFTSTFEGFGIPILEAFLLKAPVITSDCSSMREIASGESALLVDPGSEDELACAMGSLSGDDALRKVLIAGGTARLANFDWNVTMEKVVKVYYDISGKREKR